MNDLAETLSQNKVGYCYCVMLKEGRPISSQVMSMDVEVMALYSATVDDLEKDFCFFEVQRTRLEKMTLPVTDFSITMINNPITVKK